MNGSDFYTDKDILRWCLTHPLKTVRAIVLAILAKTVNKRRLRMIDDVREGLSKHYLKSGVDPYLIDCWKWGLYETPKKRS